MIRRECSLLLVGLLALASPIAPARASLVLEMGTATFSQSGTSPAQTIDGNTSSGGWAIFAGSTSAQTIVWETQSEHGFAGGSDLSFTLFQNFGNFHTIGRFRLSLTTDDRSTFANGLATGGDVTANWTVLDPSTFSATNGATLAELGDASLRASGPNPLTSVYSVHAATTLTGITGFRLEVLQDSSLPTGGPGRQPTNGNLVLTELTVDIAPVVSVPEPGALTLASLGIVALVGRYGPSRSGPGGGGADRRPTPAGA